MAGITIDSISGIWSLAKWPVLQVLKVFGVSPDPRVQFGEPFNRASPQIPWVHIPVEIGRQRWKGDLRTIHGARLRMTVRELGGEDTRVQDLRWAPDDPPHTATSLELIEGDPTCRVPLILHVPAQASLNIGGTAKTVPAGTYFTDNEFMHPHKATFEAVPSNTYVADLEVYVGHKTHARDSWVIRITNEIHRIEMWRERSAPAGRWEFTAQ